MANPKQRHTKQRRDRAREQFKITPTTVKVCTKCSAPVLPHRACPKCGNYRGREVVKQTVPKLKKSEKKEA
jgi:large subunit ribosomal protein L32